VGLADKLGDVTPQPAQPIASVRGAGRAERVSQAPKIVSASKRKKGEADRVQRVAVIGPAGVGKTHTVFSLLKHLGMENKLDPDQIRIEFIDLDGGLDELTDQKIVPDEYLDRIFISTCQDFTEVVDATLDAYERLKEHSKIHGIAGAWIVVDNMEKAWNFVQEDFSRAVYGMSHVERMKQARESQLKAKRLGQKGEAVFDKNLDWGVIKPMHSDWTKSFELCGFNVLWLSPWKMGEIKDKEGNVIEMREKFGDMANSLIVSYIIKKYLNSNGKRCADFIKSRATDAMPKNMTDTNWTAMFRELEKTSAYELKEKEVKLQQSVYGSGGNRKAPVSLGTVVADNKEKEAIINEIFEDAVDHSVKQMEKQQPSASLDW
jgi:hypothetical protein